MSFDAFISSAHNPNNVLSEQYIRDSDMKHKGLEIQKRLSLVHCSEESIEFCVQMPTIVFILSPCKAMEMLFLRARASMDKKIHLLHKCVYF